MAFEQVLFASARTGRDCDELAQRLGWVEVPTARLGFEGLFAALDRLSAFWIWFDTHYPGAFLDDSDGLADTVRDARVAFARVVAMKPVNERN